MIAIAYGFAIYLVLDGKAAPSDTGLYKKSKKGGVAGCPQKPFI
jgi:hypothetical protein